MVVVILAHSALQTQLEGWSFEEALWFTVTAGTTVGFGDLAPQTGLGRLATFVLIYIPLIPAIGYLAGALVEGIVDRRERVQKGKARVTFRRHILFVNYPEGDGIRYFTQAMEELRRSNTDYADIPVALLADLGDQGLPRELSDLGMRLVSGPPNSLDCLRNAGAGDADTVVVLTNPDLQSTGESLVFDICHQIDSLRNGSIRPRIIAESASEEMKPRLKALGVDAVVRPIRFYPGLIVRAIIAPGSESIVEALFDARGEECLRLEQPFTAMPWAKLVADLVGRDLGTPLAIEDETGAVRSDLRGSDLVSGRAVYLLVPEAAQHAFEAAQVLAAPTLEPNSNPAQTKDRG